MIWSLAGAFINVAVLTRLANWLLRRIMPNEVLRAIAVFISITIIDFLFWNYSKDFLTALKIMMYYYVPFLTLWLVTDILMARRKLRNVR